MNQNTALSATDTRDSDNTLETEAGRDALRLELSQFCRSSALNDTFRLESFLNSDLGRRALAFLRRTNQTITLAASTIQLSPSQGQTTLYELGGNGLVVSTPAEGLWTAFCPAEAQRQAAPCSCSAAAVLLAFNQQTKKNGGGDIMQHVYQRLSELA